MVPPVLTWIRGHQRHGWSGAISCEKHMLKKTFKSGLATTTCLLIDLAIGYLLIEVLSYSAALSLTVSTIVNVPLLYMLSEYVVFRERRAASLSPKRFSKFLVAVSSVFLFRQILIQALKLLDFDTEHTEYLVLVLSIALSFAFSLLLSNYWIFRVDRDATHDEPPLQGR